MKKIEVHLFSDKTESQKTFRISIAKIAFLLIGVLAAVVGFVLFSPFELLHFVQDKQIVRLYRESKQLKREINESKEFLNAAQVELENSKQLRDSLFNRQSIRHTQENLQKEIPLATRPENLSQVAGRFRKVLVHLENNPELAKALPLLRPLRGKNTVTNRFQMLYDPFTEQTLPHRGLDFAAAGGDTIYAPGAGIVSEIKAHRGFGLTLKLEHSDEIRSFYAHLEKVLVHSGERVRRGAPIAVVGNSGRAAGNILHYEIRYDGIAVSPEKFFPYSENFESAYFENKRN